jgi:phosphoribosylanthranilate isomerase
LAAYRTTSYFLFDIASHTPEAAGPADDDASREQLWAAVSKTRRKGFRVFLAGALNPSNVRAAIRHGHAFAVDVCRGVSAFRRQTQIRSRASSASAIVSGRFGTTGPLRPER